MKLDQLAQKYEIGDTLGTYVVMNHCRNTQTPLFERCQAPLAYPKTNLTSGAFSEVKLATDRATGNKYAIKIIDKAKCKGKEGMIDTEIKILQKVKHDNIISLYECFEIETKIYLVMALYVSRTLLDMS